MSRQLGLSRPAPFVIATLIRVTQARDTRQHQKSGAYHLQFTNTPESPETTQASQRPQRETDSFDLHVLDNESPPSGGRQSFFSRCQGTSHGHLLQTSSVKNGGKLNKYNGRRDVAAIAEEGESAYLSLWFRRWSVS